MISKPQMQFIRSLAIKKYRTQAGVFVLEGAKAVAELIDTQHQIQTIYALPTWINDHAAKLRKYNDIVVEISHKELEMMSELSTPNQVLAIVQMPKAHINPILLTQKFVFALDQIQDPGNLGTIIRTADWMGMPYVFCSPDCVDVFNPKTVQATMGSVLRVSVIYTPLNELFIQHPQLPVYGALLNGKNLFETDFTTQNGFLLIGNEAHGISPSLHQHITQAITIPKHGQAESLNAALAASIIAAVAVNFKTPQ